MSSSFAVSWPSTSTQPAGADSRRRPASQHELVPLPREPVPWDVLVAEGYVIPYLPNPENNLPAHPNASMVVNNPELHLCEHCGLWFPLAELLQHLHDFHRGGRLQCPLCSSTFQCSGQRHGHLRSWHMLSNQYCVYALMLIQN